MGGGQIGLFLPPFHPDPGLLNILWKTLELLNIPWAEQLQVPVSKTKAMHAHIQYSTCGSLQRVQSVVDS